jgi:predicted ATP-dependent protease
VRLAGDSGQVSIEMRAIGASDVEAAINAKFRRGDRIYRRLLDEIEKKSTRVETEGAAIGQVNGLFVINFGGTALGVPSRITARVRLGRGELVDIEREVALGGPLHSKGVLILAGFLGGRFGLNRPLSLHASLVFEQSYSGVDGDSASAAETLRLVVGARRGADRADVRRYGLGRPAGPDSDDRRRQREDRRFF